MMYAVCQLRLLLDVEFEIKINKNILLYAVGYFFQLPLIHNSNTRGRRHFQETASTAYIELLCKCVVIVVKKEVEYFEAQIVF